MSAIAFLALTAWFAAELPAAYAAGNPAAIPVDRHAAAQAVRERTDGRILAVTEVVVDGQRQFRVKVLTRNGLIRFFWIETRPEPSLNR